MAHDLKSGAGFLGAHALQRAAEALEVACTHDAPAADIDTRAATAADCLEPLVAGLQSLG